MGYGDRALERGDKGDDVVELQMRLAGFRGTVPDGDFGPGTELQVTKFQSEYMGQRRPHGRADAATLAAIDGFAEAHPVDFAALFCPCEICTGFGQGRFRNRYRRQPRVEAYHRFEYPGIHRMLLWAYRAAQFHAGRRGWRLLTTSGYRCHERNLQRGRTSTNHHGKAIDFDIVIDGPFDKRADMQNCDSMRGLLVETASAQDGWSASNRKSLEPSNIAPTWVHYDVRSYERKYLAERFFVRSPDELDRPPPAA